MGPKKAARAPGDPDYRGMDGMYTTSLHIRHNGMCTLKSLSNDALLHKTAQ